MGYDFDVVLSFAGEDREYVAKVAECLLASNVRFFYDEFDKVALWGENLYDKLHDIYSNKSLYVVMFVSSYYVSKKWTNHERVAAQARAISEKDKEYILPARFDDSLVPGLPSTIGFIDLKKMSPVEFADLIVEKVNSYLPDAARRLILELYSTSSTVRRRAVSELGMFKNKAVVDALKGIIYDDDIDVRLAVVDSLYKIEGEKVADLLLELLADGDERIQCVSIKLLGHIDGRRYVQEVLPLLGSGPSIVRMEVAKFFGVCDDLTVVPILIDLMKDKDEAVASVAKESLMNFDEEYVFRPIVNLLNDEDYRIRVKAVEILESFEEVSPFDVLVGSLEDTNSVVRKRVVRALWCVDEMLALPFLFNSVFFDKDIEVVVESLERIEEIVSDNSVNEIVKATASVPEEVRSAVVDALDEFGGSSNFSRYIQHCRKAQTDK